MSNDYELLRNPAALMVLRVWIEQGSALPLRAYIRRTANVSAGFEHSSTETDIEAAVGSVRGWLESLLDTDAAAGGADTPNEGANGNGHGIIVTEDPADGSNEGANGNGHSTNGGGL